MSGYRLITVAISPEEHLDGALLLERALKLTSADAVQVIQVCSHPVIGEGQLDQGGAEDEGTLKRMLRDELVNKLSRYHIAADNIWLCFGEPAQQIHRICRDTDSDLLIIGNREHHGLKGLTTISASAIVKAARLDVLTIYSP
ncbi:universal stress protein [Gilvimarinus sp. DA14]|uniref:universal stress protein n=1 Tax=Gilvimarinus sp. DA14 TaxID=2956798 RepID=UPI0020B77391|nr:universal stress protein [Gilvimarinus sp. DA14]UTF61140.1 universal stress protein [Gilvimarinus sp. DA14]